MHSLILASGISTPVLGVCFEEKIRRLASIIDQQEYFIDAEHIVKLEDLSSIIDRLWLNRQNVQRRLDTKMKELREKVKSNALLLSGLLKIPSKSK